MGDRVRQAGRALLLPAGVGMVLVGLLLLGAGVLGGALSPGNSLLRLPGVLGPGGVAQYLPWPFLGGGAGSPSRPVVVQPRPTAAPASSPATPTPAPAGRRSVAGPSPTPPGASSGAPTGGATPSAPIAGETPTGTNTAATPETTAVAAVPTASPPVGRRRSVATPLQLSPTPVAGPPGSSRTPPSCPPLPGLTSCSAPTPTPLPVAGGPAPVPVALAVFGGNGSSGATALFSGAVGLASGGAEVRQVHLMNTGTLTCSYTLSITGGSGLLWTDPVNGLQITVAHGATTVYQGPLDVTDVALGLALAAGQSADLTLTVDLPPSAGNQYQNLSTTVAFSLTATAG